MRNARPLSFESPHAIVNCPGRGTDEVTDGASAPRGQRWTRRLRSSTRVAIEDRPESLHVSDTAKVLSLDSLCCREGQTKASEACGYDSVNS